MTSRGKRLQQQATANQVLALQNRLNEKELAILESDAAFAKQTFHLKKLLGERERVIASQRQEIVQLQRGLHHAQKQSSDAVQAQFNDFLGQINALKVVVVQLEKKLREKSQEQVRLKESYERALHDVESKKAFVLDNGTPETSVLEPSTTHHLQRKIKSLLQAHAALVEQHRREQQSYEMELQRLRDQRDAGTFRARNREQYPEASENKKLRRHVANLLENEKRLQQTISVMADRLQEQEARGSALHEQEARVQRKAAELEALRDRLDHSIQHQEPQQQPLVGQSELQAALLASQSMCIRLDDEVKELQQQLAEHREREKRRQTAILGNHKALAEETSSRKQEKASDDSEQLRSAVDDDENVMQCAYTFLMRATALMTQLQCHLDGEVNSAQLPPASLAAGKAPAYRGTPAQLCHALMSMAKAIPDLQERVTDAYAQSLSGECAMQ